MEQAGKMMEAMIGGDTTHAGQMEKTQTVVLVAEGEDPLPLAVVPGRPGKPQTAVEVKGMDHIPATAGTNRESVQ